MGSKTCSLIYKCTVSPSATEHKAFGNSSNLLRTFPCGQIVRSTSDPRNQYPESTIPSNRHAMANDKLGHILARQDRFRSPARRCEINGSSPGSARNLKSQLLPI